MCRLLLGIGWWNVRDVQVIRSDYISEFPLLLTRGKEGRGREGGRLCIHLLWGIKISLECDWEHSVQYCGERCPKKGSKFIDVMRSGLKGIRKRKWTDYGVMDYLWMHFTLQTMNAVWGYKAMFMKCFEEASELCLQASVYRQGWEQFLLAVACYTV